MRISRLVHILGSMSEAEKLGIVARDNHRANIEACIEGLIGILTNPEHVVAVRHCLAAPTSMLPVYRNSAARAIIRSERRLMKSRSTRSSGLLLLRPPPPSSPATNGLTGRHPRPGSDWSIQLSSSFGPAFTLTPRNDTYRPSSGTKPQGEHRCVEGELRSMASAWNFRANSML